MIRYFIALAASALVLVSPFASYGDEKEPIYTVDKLAAPFIACYPRAEGRVIYTDGDRVQLDIGAKAGLRPGMPVLLFRPGKPIKHPITKKILGSKEAPLGSMTLTKVDDNSSEGTIKELEADRVVPGDVGRLPTEQVKLAVGIYGKEYNELVLDRLTGELRASARFDVLGNSELPASPAIDADAARKLIAEKSAQDLLTLKTEPTKKPDVSRVEVTLYASDGSIVERQAGLVDMKSEVFGETVMDYALVKGEHRDFFHVDNLKFRALHMAMGNITGSGKSEFAVSDDESVRVYTFNDGIMQELWSEEVTTANQILSLDCADLNNNGRDEIYVTNFSDGAMASYVIEYDGQGFKKILTGSPLFFRVLDVPGVGKKLLTATIGSDAPYSGVIREYRWAGGELKSAGRFDLPAKIKDPYGFVLVDLIPGNALEIVWVDDSDYLQVLDMKGKRIWKSKERYGGYDNFFEIDKKKFVLPNVDNRGKVKGRLIVRDGPEGSKEIVLTKNVAMTYMTRRFRGYTSAEIYSFAWEDGEMNVRWNIKNIEGYLADVCMGDVMNNGRQGIAIITDPTLKIVKKSKKLPLGSVASVKDMFAERASFLVYKIPQR